MFLRLRDPAREGHTGPGESFQPGPFRSVTHDDELTAGDRSDPLPQAQQQLDPLVLDQAPHGEEQRLGGGRGERSRLLDTVVDEPDPLARDTEAVERVGGRGGDGDQQVAAVGTGQCPAFEPSAQPGGRAGETLSQMSVWTWLTRQSVGPLCHSGAR